MDFTDAEEKGHAVYKHVYVVDLSELSMMRVLQRSNRELISHTLGAVSSFYPETMLKMFLVNAPRVFPHIWRVVQPMIDPVSAAKINILGPLDGDDAVVAKLTRSVRDSIGSVNGC